MKGLLIVRNPQRIITLQFPSALQSFIASFSPVPQLYCFGWLLPLSSWYFQAQQTADFSEKWFWLTIIYYYYYLLHVIATSNAMLCCPHCISHCFSCQSMLKNSTHARTHTHTFEHTSPAADEQAVIIKMTSSINERPYVPVTYGVHTACMKVMCPSNEGWHETNVRVCRPRRL